MEMAETMIIPSPRTKQVLELRNQGYLFKEIAKKLGITERTVKFSVYLYNIRCRASNNQLLNKYAPVSLDQTKLITYTRLEKKISMLACIGMTNPDIADILDLSPGTVRNYLHTIYDKSGASNRVELRYMLSK